MGIQDTRRRGAPRRDERHRGTTGHLPRARRVRCLGRAGVAAVALASWLLWAGASAQAVPTGMSPYIYGMHDEPSGGLLDGANSCGRGWITELQYIGWGGSCGGFDRSARAAAGIGTIMRLDSGGSPQLPTNPADYPAFAQTFAECVRSSQGVRVWIVGNEPNLNWGYMFSPAEYGEIYHQVVQAVKALPNGQDHEVLFASPGIWANVAPWGNWDDGLSEALAYVLAKPGGLVDGASIHAYTRGHETAHITSDAWFPGFTDKWHLHFRIYRDFLRVYTERGLFGMPLYITESGSACDPPCNPYDDQDKGYFLAMYEEIHQWNQANPQQVIRAVTPYRWTLNDDGTGRNFCIGCRSALVTDMQNAIALGRTWSSTGCHEPTDPPDAGVDAGSPTDAGASPDAAPAADSALPGDSAAEGDGASQPDGAQATDSGPPRPDAGGDGPGAVTSGCACGAGADDPGASQGAAGAIFLLVAMLWLLVARRNGTRKP